MDSFHYYQTLLKPLIAFKSISTDPVYRPEIQKTADWLIHLFEQHGFTTESWVHGKSNPVVYARYVTDPDAQTVLVYGHYDVQPASKADGWFSDPFSLDKRAGRFYGRGVVDNKGQSLIHIATVLTLIIEKRLAHNVIFLIEGNEEAGSSDMADIITTNRKKLTCDHIVVSDGEIPYRPTIEVGIRGGLNVEITYRTANNNLHSGIYGGGAPNAAQELSKLVASFYDANHRVTIPGFYDGVDRITAKQRSDAKALFVGNKRFKELTGITKPITQKGEDFLTATGLRPTLQVSGLISGYTDEGFASIIPAQARVNLNIRTVGSQDYRHISRVIAEAVHSRTPDYVDMEIKIEEFGNALKLNTTTPTIKHIQKLLKKAYGQTALFSYCGGSMPVIMDFKTILDNEPLLVSLGNNDCNMHGANENFSIDLLKKGLKFSELLFAGELK